MLQEQTPPPERPEPTPPQPPNQPEDEADATPQNTDRLSSASTTPTPLPMPDPYPKSSSTPVTSYTNLLRDRLEAVGVLSSSNWDKWSSLAADVAGGMMGVDFAVSYLDGTIAYPGYKENDYRTLIVDEEKSPSLAAWSKLARILKEVVEEYGGEEAASKVRHLETKMGDAPAIWKVLVEAYQRTQSGSERVTLLSQITNAQYDDETISPATFSSSLLDLRKQYNAAAKHDAERSSTPDDPDVIADKHAAISLSTLRDIFQNAMPETFAQHLELSNDRNASYADIVQLADRWWSDRRARRTLAEGTALGVAPQPPAHQPSPLPPSSPHTKKEDTRSKTQRRNQRRPRFAATKYANYDRWRGGTRERNGITLFRTPPDSCFLCFQQGHFAAQCGMREDRVRQARSRVQELAKDGIRVPEREAIALFVADVEPGAGEDERMMEDARARVVQGTVSTSFEPDEAILKTYFTAMAALHTAPATPAPPLSSLPKPSKTVDEYVLDTGANFHYTTRLDHLHGYTPFAKPRSIGGAFSSLGFAYGSGALVSRFPGGNVRIADVNYVPLLGVNLISQTTLMLRGLRFPNDRETMWIKEEDGNVLATIPVARTLHLPVRYLSLPPSSAAQPSDLSRSLSPKHCAAYYAGRTRANALVWHGRTGHARADRVKKMQEGRSTGMEVDGGAATLDFASCKSCAAGKMTRNAVGREAEHRTTRRLERLAGDVWGPSPFPGQKGARFAYAIVDDATRYMWVKPIKAKSEVAEVTAARIRREERQADAKVANFRSDRGGEFTSKALEDFFTKNGIRHETTIAYEHGQNGLIERQWRSLFETVRCWLHRSGLPLSFWDLAVVAAVHVKNLLPTTANPGYQSPHEAFHGSPPDVSHLRVWGCRVEVRLPLPSSKLHSRSISGRFVGYLDDSKGYLVWVPEQRRLVEAWSLVFYEDEFENVRSKREEDRLEEWITGLDWKEKEGAREPLPAGEEGRSRSSEEEHPTPTTPPIASPNRFSPLADLSQDEPTHHSAPTPPPRSPAATRSSQPQRPLTRAERARQGIKLPHFVPLAGAPPEQAEGNEEQGQEETGRAQNEEEAGLHEVDGNETPSADIAIALSVFAAANTSLPTPSSSELLAYAVHDYSLDTDASEEILVEADAGAVYTIGPKWSGSLDEPSFKQAMAGADKEKWLTAMMTELAAFDALETWDQDLQELPDGRRAISAKWVLVVKRDAEGRVIKYKARLVARGDQQVEGVDFDSTHSSTVRLATVRLLLALLAQHRHWQLLQFDVSNAYLHGKLDRDIYLRQPPGFVDPAFPNHVRRLRKALYGLRQGGREWQRVFREALEKIGFRRSSADHGLYIRRRGGRIVLIPTHVDDGLMIGDDDLEGVLGELNGEFGGRVKREENGLFLGMRLKRADDGTITIDQRHYTTTILDKFHFLSLSTVTTPVDSTSNVPAPADESERVDRPYRELLGALIYLSACTRPDISYAIGVASRFAACPAERHWKYLQRICRYLNGTRSLGLRYTPSPTTFSPSFLSAWCDSDHAGDRDTRRSVSGFVFSIGDDSLSSTAISWLSRRQRSVAISSTEAEYMALSEAAREGVWLRSLLVDVGFPLPSPTLIRGDNSGSLLLADHPTSHSRTKHIAVHFHFTREKVEEGIVDLKWVPTGEMVADMLTKGLGTAKHLLFRRRCGLRDCHREGGYETEEGDGDAMKSGDCEEEIEAKEGPSVE
ncbi:hypothetical protein JCM5296_002729, partial [Sporobolomyces johnsonii]